MKTQTGKWNIMLSGSLVTNPAYRDIDLRTAKRIVKEMRSRNEDAAYISNDEVAAMQAECAEIRNYRTGLEVKARRADILEFLRTIIAETESYDWITGEAERLLKEYEDARDRDTSQTDV